MDASSTHEDAHSSLPPSSPPLLPDADDEHRVYLAPIGLDTVPFASSALCDRFSEVQEHVTPSSMVNAPEVNGTAKSSALIEQRKGDPRNRAGIASYTAHWDKSSARDTAEHTEARKDKYTDVVNGYYDGATELYEYGWGESFHFCRYYKGEPFYQAIARHEHYLAHMANLKPGMRVLDVGCGVGGPAREISRFSDCEVVGLNNNEFQVQRARKYTAKAGLSNQVSFVKGDFMALAEQLGENSFDAVYAIEATCHAPTWEGVYGEIFKVLKPGGVFGVYEWCMTDRFDQSNPRHKEVQHGIELGNGIPEMRPIAQARDALTKVGFAIEHEEDLAARDDPVDWWYSLSGDLSKAQTFWDLATVWRMTHWGRNLTGWGVYWLEKVGLVPKGTHDVQEALKVAADSLVAGAKEDLFTPMMLFVARKPESSS
ncbi:sterol methyltransferase [Rhodotorula paludigena]|uniref:sterol methyltransferase n=1 Tax=Rhodotorula paludigena TaxID=86838 RepID=UPI00316E2253